MNTSMCSISSVIKMAIKAWTDRPFVCVCEIRKGGVCQYARRTALPCAEAEPLPFSTNWHTHTRTLHFLRSWCRQIKRKIQYATSVHDYIIFMRISHFIASPNHTVRCSLFGSYVRLPLRWQALAHISHSFFFCSARNEMNAQTRVYVIVSPNSFIE